MSAADFSADTAVEAAGPGRWRARILDEWSGPPGPNGGYVAALVLRAIRAEIGDPARRPRSLTLHYLRPPAAGPIETEVTIERSGRSATTCSARLRQGEKTMCIALCVLATEFEAAGQWQEPPPPAPGPDAIEPTDTSFLPPRIFQQLEMRMVFGEIPFSGASEGISGGWTRTIRPAPLEPELIAMYSDAWWPAPFARLEGPVLAPTLDLTIHFRAAPPRGEHQHVLGRFTSSSACEGFFEEDGELWAADGTLIAQSRQLALIRPWRS